MYIEGGTESGDLFCAGPHHSFRHRTGGVMRTTKPTVSVNRLCKSPPEGLEPLSPRPHPKAFVKNPTDQQRYRTCARTGL